eukprot:280515-Chlamydomonas_euryale.AAC.1
MVVRDIERSEIEFVSKTLGCLPIAHVDHVKVNRPMEMKGTGNVNLNPKQMRMIGKGNRFYAQSLHVGLYFIHEENLLVLKLSDGVCVCACVRARACNARVGVVVQRCSFAPGCMMTAPRSPSTSKSYPTALRWLPVNPSTPAPF